MSWMGLLLALLGGSLLGIFYFGGLWLTVRSLPLARHPAVLTLGSFLLRMAVSLAGFYFLMGGRVENLLACLVGFLIARQMMFKAVGYANPGAVLPGGPPP